MESLVFSVKQLQPSFQLFLLATSLADRMSLTIVWSRHSSSTDILSNGFRSMNYPTHAFP